MQLVSSNSISALDMCKDTVKGEGVGGLFKGLLAPLFGVVPYNTM